MSELAGLHAFFFEKVKCTDVFCFKMQYILSFFVLIQIKLTWNFFLLYV